ncbi:MAG: hypothetical protein AAGC78_07990 [Cellvibrio sp.]|uniref:hypothetical protein n=1 Tax=Cellvibrio sp. TaxID=1965322 RepID=UPI0031A76EBC
MSTITISSLNINNQTAKSSENTSLQGVANNNAVNTPPAEMISIYDIYGLKKGFSEQLSYKDKVTLSPVGVMLSEAHQLAELNRETWEEPSKIFETDADFNEAFKEVQSENGDLVFRRFNKAYLDQLQNVPDALLLYDQMGQSEKNKIVITLEKDLNEIGMKLQTMAMDERDASIGNSIYKTSDLFDAKSKFSELIEKEHPHLKDVDFEFTLKGDKIVITGGKINGVDLSPKELSQIETLANGKEGKELKDVMFSIREESVNHYNKYTEAGRKAPLSLNDFDQRFGDFGAYLKSFKSSGNNYKFKGPDDPSTYRVGYFSGAAEMMSGRLAA